MENKKRKIEQPTANCVSEQDVGITEFVSPQLKGFTGLIKQRYSDFQVNEIDLNREVVALKSIDGPQQTEAELQAEATKEEQKLKTTTKEVSETEQSKELAGIIGQKNVEECFKLIKGEAESSKIKTDPIDDKALRTRIHTLVREAFDSVLDSRTEDGLIAIVKVDKKTRKNQKGGFGRAPKQAEFLHFTLYKENKDTLEALSYISKMLHVPAKSMTFAGTKDRRAVTAQRVCWRRGNPNRLAGLNGAFKMGNIRLGDFKFESYTLKLGDLTGNQFKIVIRDIDGSQIGEVNKSLTSLRDNGFINYFGLQRFGTFSVSSHTIGKYILCQDYDSAVGGILNPQDVTLEDSREAREVWASERDAAKALELMPRRCVAECAMLGALKESQNSLNALLRVPHSLKTMYVHAYQSYVWNRAASERIKLNRDSIIAGDLIMAEDNERGVKRAREVTEEEIKSGSVSIFDVVLPSPGNDVLYPSNMVGFYENIMSEDGIDCHNMHHKIKEFSVFGSYRSLMAKPLYVTWLTRRYENNESTVVYTDREVLENGVRLAEEPSEEHAKTAVVLQLGLSTSQYATMALRETMKQETSRNGKIYFG